MDFQPALDYFFMNNLFVGGTISYGSESQGDFSSTEMGIGPEVGYAFGKAESKMFPYGKLGFMYRSNKSDNGTTDMTVTGTDIFIGVGLIFPVKEHIGITPELSYHMQSLKSDEEGAEAVDGSVIRLGVGISGLIW